MLEHPWGQARWPDRDRRSPCPAHPRRTRRCSGGVGFRTSGVEANRLVGIGQGLLEIQAFAEVLGSRDVDKRALGSEAYRFVVFVERFLLVALFVPDGASVRMDDCVYRIETLRLVQVGKGLIKVTAHQIAIRSLDVRTSDCRVQPDRLVKVGERTLQFTLLPFDVSAHQVSPRILVFDPNHFFAIQQRFCHIVLYRHTDRAPHQ